ncbi:MAG: hypothetical protein JWM74_2531 [Myxococcaceae bacterium]|jgi:putative oxidoreductase|nr:hypothetical protein [Myxococcaceae bacterium]
MSTNIVSGHHAGSTSSLRTFDIPQSATRFLVPIGRTLLSLHLILGGFAHFKSSTVAYAASAGVPLAGFLVPAAGVLAVVGGLMVALGFKARIGAAMIAAFLIPVTLTMHAFWSAADPQMAMFQQLFFLKNMSMLGGALLVMYFGSGPLSLDAKLGMSVRESEDER